MPLDDKVLLLPNGRELIGRKTDVDIDDAVAPRAGKMMVMLVSLADTVVMRPVRKLDAGQHSSIH